MNQFNPPVSYSLDEQEIWKVLIYNDFHAFCKGDWSLIEDDFIEEGFYGIQANKSTNKLDWQLQYDSLEAYKEDWIRQSEDFRKLDIIDNPLKILFETTKLSKIEIKGNSALINKEFNGQFSLRNSDPIILDWVSIFLMNKKENLWRIGSFVGYMSK
jgi:hypothetical protein